ncbi:recombinase family protein [Marinobacter vulgaris]|uniref:recombinase family protein n=1 Tax=Marinobacter vulgaris TaxID=1928331 RepID=UPI0011833607|nr:recombinase family protein [Marinobacter vulgaris]TSJ66963.1 recombinase family protein [Marinobacter vulgaris]
MKPKAYSYIRFSSAEQTKGHSSKRQLERAKEYAKSKNLDLVAEQEYAFLDAGKSAYKAQHLSDDGELKRFLSLVEDGSIKKGSYLLIENLDRLSRERVSVALPRFMDLLRSEIKVVTLTDERVYDENFNELDLIVSIVQMSRAHEESASKGYRVSKAWKNKQDQARNSKTPIGRACPSWLEIRSEQYEIIESRSKIVSLIFELTCKGYGRTRIVKHLNESQIAPFGSVDDGGPSSRRNKSGLWGTSSIAKILSNKAVIGEYQPHRSTASGRVPSGETVKDYYPPVISEELFYRAQKAIYDRKISGETRQASGFNFWQKITFCAQCLSPMHLINKGSPPKGYKYLVCSKSRKGSCSGRHFRYDHLEKYIPRALFMLDSLPLVQGNNSKIKKELESLEGKNVDLSEKIQKYIELMQKFPSEATAKILHESEHAISKINSEILELTNLLNFEFVSNWGDFVAKIDLQSPEGRFQANSLVRRLGIVFTLDSKKVTVR